MCFEDYLWCFAYSKGGITEALLGQDERSRERHESLLSLSLSSPFGAAWGLCAEAGLPAGALAPPMGTVSTLGLSLWAPVHLCADFPFFAFRKTELSSAPTALGMILCVPPAITLK